MTDDDARFQEFLRHATYHFVVYSCNPVVISDVVGKRIKIKNIDTHIAKMLAGFGFNDEEQEKLRNTTQCILCEHKYENKKDTQTHFLAHEDVMSSAADSQTKKVLRNRIFPMFRKIEGMMTNGKS